MLTTDQIVGLIHGLDRPGFKGHVEAVRRTQRGQGRGFGLDVPKSQRDLLDTLATVNTSQRPSRYVHPRTTAGVTPQAARGEAQPLTPSEIAFLQRLPTDPASVPFADAQQVLRLRNSITDPRDQNLLRTIADPISEYHDRKEAEADLANAQPEPAPAPAGVLPALAEAILAENPGLTEDEALGRANDLLAQVGQARAATRAERLAAARRRLDQVNAAADRRVAVHR